MTENSCVVVFPSAFAQKRPALLIKNIRRILKIRNQQYKSVRRDGPVIVVDADDPVFASSAIRLLFGIKKVAIARRTENRFGVIESEISKIGMRLLLGGDVFYVKVEGDSRGFVPGDLEMAATSSIIEQSSKTGVQPGTKDNHNKLLYTFLTRSHAYVCIFSDRGLGGVPCGIHGESMLCCVFDGLSAVSCMETIKQGFDVEIIVCYKKRSQLLDLAKMINRIIPRLARKSVELGFFRVSPGGAGHLAYLGAVFGIMQKVAKEKKISRVSLPVSPVIFSARLIERFIWDFVRHKITAYTPLGALEEEIYTNAREVGLEKFMPKGLHGIGAAGPQKPAGTASVDSKTITVEIGPNNVHDILDKLAGK